MKFCGDCGGAIDGARFCPQCGAEADPDDAGASAEAPQRIERPVGETERSDTLHELRARRAPSTFSRRVLGGNWLGAAAVAATTALSTGVLSAALVLLAKPVDFGLANTLGLTTMVASQAWGVDSVGEVGVPGFARSAGELRLEAFPLTVTVVAGLVALLAFRILTRHHRDGLDTVLDAFRVAMIFAVCMWLPGLLLGVDNRRLGQGWGYELAAEQIDLRVRAGAATLSAIPVAFALMLSLLLLSVIARRGLWRGPMDTVHQWCFAPIRSVGLFLAVAPLLGIVGYAAVLLYGGDVPPRELGPGGGRTAAAVAIAFAGNAVLWLVALGAGASMQASARTQDDRVNLSESLSGPLTDSAPGLWVAPMIVLVLLTVLTTVALRDIRATARPGPPPVVEAGRVGGFFRRRSVGAALVFWLLSLLVILPLVLRLSGASASGAVRYGVGYRSAGEQIAASLGPDIARTTLSLFAAAALMAFVLAMAMGIIDHRVVLANLSGTGHHGGVGPRGVVDPGPQAGTVLDPDRADAVKAVVAGSIDRSVAQLPPAQQERYRQLLLGLGVVLWEELGKALPTATAPGFAVEMSFKPGGDRQAQGLMILLPGRAHLAWATGAVKPRPASTVVELDGSVLVEVGRTDGTVLRPGAIALRLSTTSDLQVEVMAVEGIEGVLSRARAAVTM